jgi:hypothetical protein
MVCHDHEVVDLADARPSTDGAVPGRRPKWGWRRRLAATAAVVALAAGAVTITALVRHYRYAKSLECICVLNWAADYRPHLPDSTAGDVTQMTVLARPAIRQGFDVGITNPSSVTQTILGLPRDEHALLIRPQLAVGSWGGSFPIPRAKLRSAPIALPPGASAELELTFRARCLARGGAAEWSDIPVRVRVGAFTRTEDISLDSIVMAVRGTKRSVACPGVS